MTIFKGAFGTHVLSASRGLLVSLALCFMAGCGQQAAAPAPVSALKPDMNSQYRLCEVDNWMVASVQCAEGSLVSFLPNRWGNDQLPLIAASVICDFNYPVVHNKGGVVCVFTKKRMDNLAAEQQKKDQPPAADEGKKK